MSPSLVLVCAIIALEPAYGEKAAEAYVKQYRLDEALRRYQEDLFTEGQKRVLGNTAIIVKVAVERKITFRWEF